MENDGTNLYFNSREQNCFTCSVEDVVSVTALRNTFWFLWGLSSAPLTAAEQLSRSLARPPPSLFRFLRRLAPEVGEIGARARARFSFSLGFLVNRCRTASRFDRVISFGGSPHSADFYRSRIDVYISIHKCIRMGRARRATRSRRAEH